MDSIMQFGKYCYITGDTRDLHKHHIFGGNPNRKISEKHGFWVWLRSDWHNGADYGVHFDRELDLKLKGECQRIFEEEEGGTREEFRRLIGRSYL